MKAGTSRKTTVGALGLTFALGAGLLATTGAADAGTGQGTLSSLLDRKLEGVRDPSGEAPASPGEVAADAEGAEGAVGVAGGLALAGLSLAALIFVAALWVRRVRERRIGEALGSHLAVKESVWIGRGQRVLLLTFENHKVLVGVSGGAIHNLGVFGEGEGPVAPPSPIERAAAKRGSEEKNKTSEFSDFVKGELAEGISSLGVGGQDRRRKMIKELNTL